MKKRSVAIVLLLALLVNLIWFIPDFYDSTYGANTYVQEVTDYVNLYRKEVGVYPLTQIPKLSDVCATIRANEIAEYFDHTRPNGSKFSTVLTENGFNLTSAENIAAGYRSVSEVMQAWRNSSGHYENIISTKFNHIGVGYVYKANDPNKYGHYWVQLFLGGCTITSISMQTAGTVSVDVGTGIDSMNLYANVACSRSEHGISILKITSDLCSGYDPNKQGLQTVTVRYKEASTTFQVQVGAVQTEPATLQTESATKPTESATLQTESATKPTESATLQTESATVQTESATVQTESATVKDLSVTYIGGDKYAGDSVKASDFSVVATLSDGTKQTVSGNKVTVTSSALKAGSNKITVSYQGISKQISVNVKALEVSDIRISYTGGTKQAGDVLQASDFRVDAVYNNGTVQSSVAGWSLDHYGQPLQAGDNVVTIRYNNITKTYTLKNVSEKPTEPATLQTESATLQTESATLQTESATVSSFSSTERENIPTTESPEIPTTEENTEPECSVDDTNNTEEQTTQASEEGNLFDHFLSWVHGVFSPSKEEEETQTTSDTLTDATSDTEESTTHASTDAFLEKTEALPSTGTTASVAENKTEGLTDTFAGYDGASSMISSSDADASSVTKDKKTQIFSIIVAFLILLLVVQFFLILFFLCKKRKKEEQTDENREEITESVDPKP